MSFPRYPKYKPSGVAWLGDIPEHWGISRLKGLCDIQTGSRDTENAVDDGEYAFFVRSQTVERINTCAFSGEAILTAGDGAGVGKVFHHFIGPFDFHQRVYMLNHFRGTTGRFLFHYLRENFFKVALEGVAKSTVDSLRRPMLTNFPAVVPPGDEQDAIIKFCDNETHKIDTLVSEQEGLIALLKEKRDATISHAVTRGLNPNAPMKSSGIEWLGPVPAHWRLERGRWLFKLLANPPEPSDGVVTAFRDGQVTLRELRRTEGFTLAVLEVGYQHVRKGDLVIHGMDAFAGAIGVAEQSGKCSPEYQVLTPLLPGVENAYFARVLRMMALRNWVYVICPSVRERAPRFRFEAFKDVLLPVPPHEEQQAILTFIERYQSEVDPLISEAERAIALLQERRAALISAVVTGQIDVRKAPERQTV